MKAAFFLLTFIFSIPSFSMDAKELIGKMQKNYNDKSHIEYTCTYELFKGHKSDVVEERYKGFFYRNKSNVYQKIDETEFVYATDFFLQISHSEKMMSLSQAQKLINTTVDLDLALKHCSKTELEEKDGYYSITLIIKNNSDLPFSVVKMRIDKKEYFLERLDVYYSEALDFSQEYNKNDQDRPHLKITFDEPKLNPKTLNYFELNRYFSKNSSGILKLTEKYAGYTLVDNRLH
ncbi:hypothetical protein D3C71_598710 [compost metagenome]